MMFKPNGQRKDIPLKADCTVIGRAEDCSLRIPLVSVSRRHCEVSIEGDEVKVKDLASSNGTYVNGTRINETILEAGDKLMVGPIGFTVQIDGIPEQIEPVAVTADGQADGDIVDLEIDAFDELSGDEVMANLGGAVEDESHDSITALEALAEEDDEEEEEL